MDHVVQFYREDVQLIASIVELITQGFEQDEALVIICTSSHWKQIETSALLIYPSFLEKINSKQLIFFDAAQTLPKVLDDNGLPDQERFNRIIGSIYKSLVPRFLKIKFYGELVNLLYQKNARMHAHILETYWNEFLVKYPNCSLLCGYSCDNITQELQREVICHTHSEVKKNLDS